MELVAEILERAAEALESERLPWTQYRSAIKLAPSGFCASEAICQVTIEMFPLVTDNPFRGLRERNDLWADAVGAASRHVTKGRDSNHLTAWNDAPGRTLAEVVEAFKETAKDLRNKA